jgi:hypothetical protein
LPQNPQKNTDNTQTLSDKFQVFFCVFLWVLWRKRCVFGAINHSATSRTIPLTKRIKSRPERAAKKEKIRKRHCLSNAKSILCLSGNFGEQNVMMKR